jgi:hypothetical protein
MDALKATMNYQIKPRAREADGSAGIVFGRCEWRAGDRIELERYSLYQDVREARADGSQA